MAFSCSQIPLNSTATVDPAGAILTQPSLAWTGALIITLAVLSLSILARALSAPRKSS